MKRTIQGTRYDSERAHKIGNAVELGHWGATLYKTPRSNRYFLAGQGNPMTVFRGKDRIIPLTRDAAVAWARTYLGKEI
jgi:hypothetical protein